MSTKEMIEFTDKHIAKFRLKMIPVPGSACLIWKNHKDKWGYGYFRAKVNGEIFEMRAHRVSFALFNGPLLPGKCVLHHCDNPGCVNPEHLFLGTNQDNTNDMLKKGRCRCGSRVKTAKLNEEKVAEMRLLNQQGVGRVRLSKRFGVNGETVRRIIKRERWRHVL